MSSSLVPSRTQPDSVAHTCLVHALAMARFDLQGAALHFPAGELEIIKMDGLALIHQHTSCASDDNGE